MDSRYLRFFRNPFVVVLIGAGLFAVTLSVRTGHALADCGIHTGNLHDYAGLVVDSKWVDSGGGVHDSNDTRVIVNTVLPTASPGGNVVRSLDDGASLTHRIGGDSFSQFPAGCMGDGVNAVWGYGATSTASDGTGPAWMLDCDWELHNDYFQAFDVTGEGVPTGARAGGWWDTTNVAPPNGDTHTREIYYHEPPPPDNPPGGDTAPPTCDMATGWAFDIDSRYTSIEVHIYIDAPAGPGVTGVPVTADKYRPDVNLIFSEPPPPAGRGIGQDVGDYHGFEWIIPAWLKDGNPHTLYYYAIGVDAAGNKNGNNPQLSNSPRTLGPCPPTPVVTTQCVAGVATATVSWSGLSGYGGSNYTVDIDDNSAFNPSFWHKDVPSGMFNANVPSGFTGSNGKTPDPMGTLDRNKQYWVRVWYQSAGKLSDVISFTAPTCWQFNVTPHATVTLDNTTAPTIAKFNSDFTINYGPGLPQVYTDKTIRAYSNTNKPKCLDVNGGGTANGTPVVIWDCHGGSNQQWEWLANGTLRSVSSGKCLNIAGNNPNAGAQIIIYDCSPVPAPNEKWTHQSNGWLKSSISSGRCLDIPGATTTNGTQLQIWDCNNSPAQIFGGGPISPIGVKLTTTRRYYILKTDGSTVNIPPAPSPSPDSQLFNPPIGTPYSYPIDDTRSPLPPVSVGDKICSSLTVNFASGTVNTTGDPDPATSVGPAISPDDCITVASKPYFQLRDGDIAAGISGTCTGWSGGAITGTITAWNDAGIGGANKGAGTNLAAYALNLIDGFASAQPPPVGPPPNTSAPNDLSFANTTLPFGGYYAAGAACPKDYYSTGDTLTSSGAGPVSLNGGGTGDSAFKYVPGGGSSFVKITGGNVSIKKRRTIYIDGDAYITGDITFVGGGPGLAVPDLTSVYIVAKGNIYIDPSVTQLDGVYVAQPDSSGNRGSIYTCSTTGTGPPTGAELNGVCKTNPLPLTVNGAFIAKQLKLYRSKGSINTVPAAEIFNYTPATWLAVPDLIGNSGFNNGYDAITSLPPVL